MELHYKSHPTEKQIGGRISNPISGSSLDIGPFTVTKDFGGDIVIYEHSGVTYPLFDLYFAFISKHIKNILIRSLNDLGMFKVTPHLAVTFARKIGNEIPESFSSFELGELQIVINRDKVDTYIEKMRNSLKTQINLFEKNGSGYVLQCVNGLQLRIGVFNQTRGGCFIPTPDILKKTRAIINLKNNNDQCFKWAVICALHKVGNNTAPKSSYEKFEENYDFSMLTCPVFVGDVHRFEKRNPGIGVNIFSYVIRKGVVKSRIELLPEYISNLNYVKGVQIANLLLIENKKHSHFVTVKDVSKLIGERGCTKSIICYNCMCRFSKNNFNIHLEDCRKNDFQAVKMPTSIPFEVPTLKFSNFQNTLKQGFVAYSDFESILSPVDQEDVPCKKMKIEMYDGNIFPYTKIRQVHLPAAWAITVVDVNGELYKEIFYKGPDCVEKYLQALHHLSEEVINIYKNEKKPLRLTKEEEESFKIATKCCICEDDFMSDDEVLRHHDHLTGKYVGPIHRSCNRKMVQRRVLPVLIHNLKNYDMNLIIKGFQSYGKNIKIIPCNSSKYLAVKVNNILFLDSFSFLPSSLQALCDVMRDDDRNFRLLNKSFGENAHLLKRKGVFCYDYIKDFSVFNETELPRREFFYNSLTNEDISEQDFCYAKKLFEVFKCKTLWDYCLLYLRTDTYILMSVFERFRKMSLEYYNLDPVHYFSVPGLAYDASLKFTKVELELINSPLTYNFLQSGLRGGVSIVPKRYCKADNPYVSDREFGPNDLQTYIFFIDCVNLYGRAMLEPLPVSDFKWVSKENFCEYDPRIKGSKNTAIYEVDLVYPKILHNSHNSYPVAPSKLAVPYELLSPYQKQLIRKSGIEYNSKIEKLIPHFFPRKKYIVHGRLLEYYLQEGLELTKIHRILSFKDKNWMAPYILFNTEKRKNANSAFERDLFKLFINSTFGRICMNKRRRMEVKLVKDRVSAKTHLRRPNFKYYSRITKNMFTFTMSPRTVLLDSPLYTGFSILEFSKLIMYIFHYQKMRKYFPDSQVIASDTDSFIYQVDTYHDLYDILHTFRHEFDFSDYPSQGHPNITRLKSDDNKKRLGCMKDETNGRFPTEFVGLASKSYSLQIGDVSKQTAKGTAKLVKQKFLHHDLYKEVLFTQNKVYSTALYIRNNLSRTQDQRLCTVELRKASLSAFDSKFYIRSDGVRSYAFGHYKTQQNISPS